MENVVETLIARIQEQGADAYVAAMQGTLRSHLVEERRSHLNAAERLEKRIKQLDQMMKPLDKDAAQR